MTSLQTEPKRKSTRTQPYYLRQSSERRIKISFIKRAIPNSHRGLSRLISIIGQVLQTPYYRKICRHQPSALSDVCFVKNMTLAYLIAMFAISLFAVDAGTHKSRTKETDLHQEMFRMREPIITSPKQYRRFWRSRQPMKNKRFCIKMIKIPLGLASSEKIANYLYFEIMGGMQL